MMSLLIAGITNRLQSAESLVYCNVLQRTQRLAVAEDRMLTLNAP